MTRCTLDIAPQPLSEGTSLQKRSGMARVVEGCHSFTCTRMHPHVYPRIERNYEFSFSAEVGPHLGLPTPVGWKADRSWHSTVSRLVQSTANQYLSESPFFTQVTVKVAYFLNSYFK